MVRFPSDEWIKIFKEELNKSKAYEKVAKTWEGDFLFVITPDEELKEEVTFYVDLWHGKCRDAFLTNKEKGKINPKFNAWIFHTFCLGCLNLQLNSYYFSLNTTILIGVAIKLNFFLLLLVRKFK